MIPGTNNSHTVDASKYTLKTAPGITSDTEDDIANCSCDSQKNCTFEIQFTQEFCDELSTNDKIVVIYEAMLNRNADIAGEGNPNTAWLTFGEGHKTTEDITTTFTYSIDIVKTDIQNTLISGAQFEIYDAATGGNKINVVPLKDSNEQSVKDENDNPVYRRAREDETGVVIAVEDGIVTIVGMDNGTYYLEELVAPTGYNKLTSRQKFIISDSNLDATFNGTIYSTGSGVHVVNKTGSMLPETGGMGTVLFITIGTILALGAGVVLVTKKRMANIAE